MPLETAYGRRNCTVWVKNASGGIDTQKETSKGHIPRIFFVFFFLLFFLLPTG
jgi:hypothetical protein